MTPLSFSKQNIFARSPQTVSRVSDNPTCANLFLSGFNPWEPVFSGPYAHHVIFLEQKLAQCQRQVQCHSAVGHRMPCSLLCLNVFSKEGNLTGKRKAAVVFSTCVDLTRQPPPEDLECMTSENGQTQSLCLQQQ